MNRTILIPIALLTVFITCIARAQPPDTAWTRTYGGDYSEVPFAGTFTSDGCFIIAGYTSSFGAWQCDGYFVKIDMNGDTVWTRMYGAAYYDYAMDIIEAADSGIVMAGKHSFFSGGVRNAWLIKMTPGGDKVWEQNYQAATDLETNGLCQTSDGGYALTGYTSPYGNYDMFLLRTDENGDSLWMRTYGGDLADEGVRVLETPDSGFIIAAYSKSYGAGDYDIHILRTDKNGDSLWAQTFGSDQAEVSPAMIRCANGDYMILTNTYNPGLTRWPVYLIRMDADGNNLWTKEVEVDLSVTPRHLCETADSGFVIVGSAGYGYPKGNDVYMMRIDSNGDTLWTTHHGGNSADQGVFVAQNDAGEILVGASWAVSSTGDFYAIKLDAQLVGVEETGPSGIPSGYRLSQNYPNPFNPATTISFDLPENALVTMRIYSVGGSLISVLVNREMEPGRHMEHFDGGHLPSGVYYCRLSASGKEGIFVNTKKMILLR